MPKPSRSQNILLRVSPAEKATLEERAEMEALTVSEYIRREAGIGKWGSADLRRTRKPKTREPGHVAPELEARVKELSRRMPRRNAEQVAKREEAVRKAREALRA